MVIMDMENGDEVTKRDVCIESQRFQEGGGEITPKIIGGG